MRDIRELLTEKESELERVRKEIQSLHAVIPLLEDERPGFEPDRKPVSSAQVAGAASSGEDSKSGFWNFGRNSRRDRKSTRLNSSHVKISYAVFCLKKKKKKTKDIIRN